MFKRKHIDERVQKALFRKINAMNRKKLDGSDTNFFVGNALEPQDDSNPIEQHLYRGCFAKVNVAVPNVEKSTESNIVLAPISISSYIENKSNTEGILESVTQKDAPLAFQQGFQEKSNNRFLGHSGITSISVEQLEYYTYKYTIDWVCPDPVYFEEVFEPSFLKLGAYCAIEFGWGNDDREFQVPALSIQEMIRLLEGKNLIERNLKTAGNYHCGVGTVIKFDWKILENGVYSGNLQVLTPGASALLETTQGTSNRADSIAVTKLIKDTIDKAKIAENLKDKKTGESKEEKAEREKESKSAKDVSDTLKDNSILFNLVIKNLKDVMDKKLAGEKFSDTVIKDSPYGSTASKIGYDKKRVGNVEYKYKDGLLNVKAGPETIVEKLKVLIGKDASPDYFKNRYFCNWGWFEDNILKDFFKLEIETSVGVGDKPLLQNIDSKLDDVPNICQSSKYLYSLGLDHVILPNKHQILLTEGFNAIKDKTLIEDYYSPQQRIDLMRMHAFYNIIDKKFPNFLITPAVMKKDDPNTEDIDESIITETSGKASIRNMVFPLEMFITHFQNTPSLRQGLRNFWTDVSNQYGGYWGFQIGEAPDQPGVVGVFDSYFAPENLNTMKLSSEDDPTKEFQFSILSKNSIVKSFDISLNFSAEASVQARYGGSNSLKTGNQKQDGKKDLGIEAWNILTSNTTLEENLTKKDLENSKNIQQTITGLSYPTLERTFYTTIDSIMNDEKTYREQVENKTTNIVEGVGCYTKKGNFSQYFKSVMLHLINYSTLKGSESNIEQGQIMLPVSLTMTLDGIGGLQVGNIFSVDYLPELYRDNVYFQIMKVGHKVTTAGWDTELEAVMVTRMKKVLNEPNGLGKQLDDGLKDYLELFKITNINDYDGTNDAKILGANNDRGKRLAAAVIKRKTSGGIDDPFGDTITNPINPDSVISSTQTGTTYKSTPGSQAVKN